MLEELVVPLVDPDAPVTTKKAKAEKAPASHSDAVLAALRLHQDQPKINESPIVGDVTITLGIRNVYFSNGTGSVFVVPGMWTD